ncbi:MAG: GTPase domain-containing protein [Gammaproteobacteria bacterium]|nr:GTPase domain-containing protein [Gammaproteobacteria bacterium]
MSINSDIDVMRKKLEEEKKNMVSVALFGQPGAGKSSIINKIIGKNIAEVSVETDKTTEEESFVFNGLNFVDLPGYGTKKFPKEEYFNKFNIEGFDLFLCVTSGKLHQADTEFFKKLSKGGKVCLFVANKHDDLWEEGVSIEQLEIRKASDIRKHVGREVDVIFTSCKETTGFDELNLKISDNLDDAKKERWVRSAKAYSTRFLDEKREACSKYVAIASGAAAANGINPIPGVDIAVDITIIVGLFKQIRNDYGLSEENLGALKTSSLPAVAQLANKVLRYIARDGVLLLLKNYAGRETLKAVTKYIPFVGQVVAAGLGYAITSNAGKNYLDDCHDLAFETLKNKLEVEG